MLNIVVSLAGQGSRFLEAGYKDPKPLIPVMGKTMIQQVVENLKPSAPHRFIFICQTKHLKNYSLRALLEYLAPGCKIVDVCDMTGGSAYRLLIAKYLINNADPLMIAPWDQYMDVNIDEYLAAFDASGADGLIMTMKADGKKRSFIEHEAAGRVTQVVENDAGGDEAAVGIYNYRHGHDFVWATQQMIAKNLRVNNEFYVAPTYNELIAAGKTIAYHNVGACGAGMYDLGTPDDLEKFIAAKAPALNRPLWAMPVNPRICVLSSGLDRVYKNCSEIFKKQIALSEHHIDFYGLFWEPMDNDKMNYHLEGFQETNIWTAPQREFGDLSNLEKPSEMNPNNFFSMLWGRWLLAEHMTQENIWDRYDLFIYCRPDVCLDNKVDLLFMAKQLEFTDLFIPINGNQYWGGGANDQVCFGNRKVLDYLNMFQDVAQYIQKGVWLHPETMLKHHLITHDVSYAIYPVQSFIFMNETNFHLG